MDFSLTTEQIDIQKAAREYAKGEFDPDAALEYDQNQRFPSTIWKKACGLGFLMSKMIEAKTAYRITYDAVHVYGGSGYMTESHIEHFYRDSKVLDLFLEPGQIQRNMLADQITGRTG